MEPPVRYHAYLIALDGCFCCCCCAFFESKHSICYTCIIHTKFNLGELLFFLSVSSNSEMYIDGFSGFVFSFAITPVASSILSDNRVFIFFSLFYYDIRIWQNPLAATLVRNIIFIPIIHACSVGARGS